MTAARPDVRRPRSTSGGAWSTSPVLFSGAGAMELRPPPRRPRQRTVSIHASRQARAVAWPPLVRLPSCVVSRRPLYSWLPRHSSGGRGLSRRQPLRRGEKCPGDSREKGGCLSMRTVEPSTISLASSQVRTDRRRLPSRPNCTDRCKRSARQVGGVAHRIGTADLPTVPVEPRRRSGATETL